MMHNGMPVTSMAQLAAMMTPGAGMNSLQPPAQYVTADQVRAMIAEQIKPVAQAQQANPIMAQFESLIQRALTPEAYKEFLAYSALSRTIAIIGYVSDTIIVTSYRMCVISSYYLHRWAMSEH